MMTKNPCITNYVSKYQVRYTLFPLLKEEKTIFYSGTEGSLENIQSAKKES